MKTVLFVIMMLVCSFTNAASFKVTSDGEVGAYFVGSSAGYENQLTANFSDVDNGNLFISNRSTEGDYFSFGEHSVGSQVVIADHVIDTGNWFYSIDAFNDDGLRHIQYSSFSLNDGMPILLVGFEDLYGGGDLDFNDHVVMFTNISAVPEPETYAMLLLGLGLLGVFSRRA